MDNTEEKEVNPIEESILNSIKKLLGIPKDYTNFDTDIIIHINTVFMTLNQLGVGPVNGFKIKDSNNLWSEYVNEDDDLEAIKSYIYLKVKMIFDPSLNSTVLEAHKQLISELEWRLNINTNQGGQ
jgi:hypothetical protein